jgi:hypothetical protein
MYVAFDRAADHAFGGQLYPRSFFLVAWDELPKLEFVCVRKQLALGPA